MTAYYTDRRTAYAFVEVTEEFLVHGAASGRRYIRASLRKSLEEHGPIVRLRYVIDPVERHGSLDGPRATRERSHIVMAVATIERLVPVTA